MHQILSESAQVNDFHTTDAYANLGLKIQK
jgi:hypothetical protein